jgi:CRP-like cAMP-binding protein
MPRPFDTAQLETTDSEIGRLLECCSDAERLCFDDGEYFFQEDEARDEVYMVLRGAFVVEQHNGKGDREIIASQCVGGDEPCFVGEMAYFGGGSRTAAVRSSGASFALVLKPKHMDAILGSFPSLTRTFCSQLSMRLKETNDTLKRITANNAMQASQVNLEEGEILVRQGDTPDRLYHLLFGDLAWEVDGEQVMGGTFQEFVEPAAYLSGRPYEVTVRAKSPTCLVAIEQGSRQAVVRNYPELILQLFEAGAPTTG